MINIKTKLMAPMIFAMAITGAKAQSVLSIVNASGDIRKFNIEDVKTLTFNANRIAVNVNSGSVEEFTLSSLRQLTFNDLMNNTSDQISSNNNPISCYPNPVDDQLTVRYESQTNTTVLIEIIDLQGKVIIHKSMVCNQGVTLVELPVAELASGFYICRLQINNNIESIKFSKN